MRIAIDINEVLRDTYKKAEFVYEKFFVLESNADKVSIYDEEKDEWVEIEDNEFAHELSLPIDTTDLINHFRFETEDDLYNFFYTDFPMQIFGHAPSKSGNTFNVLNDLYTDIREEHDITLISEEIGKSKPATLFFLSKYGCLVENIQFYSPTTVEKIISEFDVIITANPKIIQYYGEKPIIVKYETLYNKDMSSDYVINTVDEIDKIIKKI